MKTWTWSLLLLSLTSTAVHAGEKIRVPTFDGKIELNRDSIETYPGSTKIHTAQLQKDATFKREGLEFFVPAGIGLEFYENGYLQYTQTAGGKARLFDQDTTIEGDWGITFHPSGAIARVYINQPVKAETRYGTLSCVRHIYFHENGALSWCRQHPDDYDRTTFPLGDRRIKFMGVTFSPDGSLNGISPNEPVQFKSLTCPAKPIDSVPDSLDQGAMWDVTDAGETSVRPDIEPSDLSFLYNGQMVERKTIPIGGFDWRVFSLLSTKGCDYYYLAYIDLILETLPKRLVDSSRSRLDALTQSEMTAVCRVLTGQAVNLGYVEYGSDKEVVPVPETLRADETFLDVATGTDVTRLKGETVNVLQGPMGCEGWIIER